MPSSLSKLIIRVGFPRPLSFGRDSGKHFLESSFELGFARLLLPLEFGELSFRCSVFRCPSQDCLEVLKCSFCILHEISVLAAQGMTDMLLTLTKKSRQLSGNFRKSSKQVCNESKCSALHHSLHLVLRTMGKKFATDFHSICKQSCQIRANYTHSLALPSRRHLLGLF